MARYIEVNWAKYRVVESLGFVQDIGMRAVIVWADGKERTAVKEPDGWRFWTPQERVQPLIDGLNRQAVERAQREDKAR